LKGGVSVLALAASIFTGGLCTIAWEGDLAKSLKTYDFSPGDMEGDTKEEQRSVQRKGASLEDVHHSLWDAFQRPKGGRGCHEPNRREGDYYRATGMHFEWNKDRGQDILLRTWGVWGVVK